MQRLAKKVVEVVQKSLPWLKQRKEGPLTPALPVNPVPTRFSPDEQMLIIKTTLGYSAGAYLFYLNHMSWKEIEAEENNYQLDSIKPLKSAGARREWAEAFPGPS